MNDCSIYIHIPWCRRRCPYCDFYLVVGKPKENFLEALFIEWAHRKHNYLKKPASSIYFGGGTPSLLEPQKIVNIIDFLITENAIAHNAEITVEANPEDLLGDYAIRLSKTLVNRVSMGVQSFDDKILRLLGRKHTSSMAKMAIDNLLSAGFKNISIDLIIGCQSEQEKDIIASLKYLYQARIPHISAYLLTIEERTKFYTLIKEGRLKSPCEDSQAQIYKLVQDELISLGYVQYDISSYALPDFFSRHNQVYWALGNYMGLGPGAHSMRFLLDGGIERVHNRSKLKEWLIDPKKASLEIDLRSKEEALKESLAFGLRNLVKGIKPQALAKRHKKALPKDFFAIIKKYKDLGWLDEHDNTIRISPSGVLFADSIMRDIICC